MEISYNEIEKSLYYLTPTTGKVTATFGFGYSGDSSNMKFPWDGINIHHLDIVSNLLSEELLTMIISGRSQVRLQNSGSELDVSDLQALRDRLHEENLESLNQISTPVTFFG